MSKLQKWPYLFESLCSYYGELETEVFEKSSPKMKLFKSAVLNLRVCRVANFSFDDDNVDDGAAAKWSTRTESVESEKKLFRNFFHVFLSWQNRYFKVLALELTDD